LPSQMWVAKALLGASKANETTQATSAAHRGNRAGRLVIAMKSSLAEGEGTAAHPRVRKGP
jgi:hypothetical protein